MSKNLKDKNVSDTKEEDKESVTRLVSFGVITFNTGQEMLAKINGEAFDRKAYKITEEMQEQLSNDLDRVIPKYTNHSEKWIKVRKISFLS